MNQVELPFEPVDLLLQGLLQGLHLLGTVFVAMPWWAQLLAILVFGARLLAPNARTPHKRRRR